MGHGLFPRRWTGQSHHAKVGTLGSEPGVEGVGLLLRSVEERADRIRSASRRARSRKGGSLTESNGSGPMGGSERVGL